MDIQKQLRESIQNLMNDKHLNKAAMAQIAETDGSQFGRIMKGTANFTLAHLENFANYFDLRAIDLFTYPDIYTAPEKKGGEPSEVLLQIRLTKEKKDQVLKLVFGENNIEILNK